MRFLMAETLARNFAPWSALGRTLGLGLRVARQQAWFDRRLENAKRGKLDYDVPKFSA